MRSRRYLIGIAGLLLGMSTILVLAAGGASASVSNPPTVTANGTASCGTTWNSSNLTGTITFLPPLVNGGTAAETTKVKIKMKHCTTPGNTNLPHGGHLTGKINELMNVPGSVNSCQSLETSVPLTFTIKWTFESNGVVIDYVRPTIVTFSGYYFPTPIVPPPPAVFQFPGGSNSATAFATGSFTGTDSGTSSSMEMTLSLTQAQFATACASPGGLASALFTSGYSYSG